MFFTDGCDTCNTPS
jgi:predicted DNA-binding protein YlxM (UPF0122 family)